MKIKEEEHFKNTWIVQALLTDFEVEDVWQFPVTLEKQHNISLFQGQLFEAMEQLSQKGLVGLLFKLRFFLGEIFGWDTTNPTTNNILKKGSIRERYAQVYHLKKEDLPTIGTAEFEPVYVLPNESLAEIKNETVHAGLHLAKVPFKEAYTVQMTVYVKPKGNLGKFYMALIKPFRLAIVYPAMMRMVEKHWATYIQEEKK